MELEKAGVVTPEMTSLQMEAGEVGVVYNTLINQTRDFSIVTRDSNGKQVSEKDVVMSAEIQEPNNLNRNVVPVQDCGDGRYTFSYKPTCTGNYQVSVKVNGADIQGSPFSWGVEQWHLVDKERGGNDLSFSKDNMTVVCTGVYGRAAGNCGFTSDAHSWKVKVLCGGLFAVGVTDCDVLPEGQASTWCTCEGAKYYLCNGDMVDEGPSNIPWINEDDVTFVYLNHHNKTLTVYHPSSGQTDTWNDVTVETNNLYPNFRLRFNSAITLDLELETQNGQSIVII